MHDADAVAHGEGLLLVMRDVEEGDVELALEALELELHLLSELQVQSPERFVEEQHLGVVAQRSGDGDALHLSTGELGGPATLEGGELDEGKDVRHAPDDLVLGDLAHLEPIGDVVEDRHVRKERIALEHGVDVALVGFAIGHVLAAQQDFPGRGLLEAADHTQRRGLTGARGAQYREELALEHVEVEVPHHMVVSVELVDVPYLDNWLSTHGHHPYSRRFGSPDGRRPCLQGLGATLSRTDANRIVYVADEDLAIPHPAVGHVLTDVRNDRLDVLVLDHDACLDLGKQVYVHLESADLVDALVAGEALLGAAAHDAHDRHAAAVYLVQNLLELLKHLRADDEHEFLHGLDLPIWRTSDRTVVLCHSSRNQRVLSLVTPIPALPVLDGIKYQGKRSKRRRRNGRFESCEMRETDGSAARNGFVFRAERHRLLSETFAGERGHVWSSPWWRGCVRHVIAMEACVRRVLHR